MQGSWDYVIHVDQAYNDKYKTESGLELYGDKRFSDRLLANRIATVVNTPLKEETILKEGYQVMFDPAILLEPLYDHGRMPSPYLIDVKQSWYKLRKELIAMWRENENDEWKTFNNTAMIELVPEAETTVKSSIIFIPESTKPKFKKGFGVLIYGNDQLANNDVNEGDMVYYKPNKYAPNEPPGIEYMINGKKRYWVRNSHIIAKINVN